jgi:hypothetical protein
MPSFFKQGFCLLTKNVVSNFFKKNNTATKFCCSYGLVGTYASWGHKKSPPKIVSPCCGNRVVFITMSVFELLITTIVGALKELMFNVTSN